MKTWFQNSRKRSVSSPGRSSAPPKASAAVEVELRAGAAGAGRPGLPEVVLAPEPDDPLVRDAGGPPDLDRLLVGAQAELLVAAEDGDPDPLRVHPEALGRELPAPGDRLGLEVVAEAPVAEHLEEGEVAGGVADLLDVGRAEAFLHVGEARRRRLFATQEVGLEGLHPGRGQQHRGVVDRGNERGRGDDPVPALLEEREVGVADLLGPHVRKPKYPGRSRRCVYGWSVFSSAPTGRASLHRWHRGECLRRSRRFLWTRREGQRSR